jgi:Fe-S-cluster containining protein
VSGEREGEAGGFGAFFEAQRDNFSKILAQGCGDARLADALTAQACDNYRNNAEIQAEDEPASACERGCDACCCLQVSATAPEIFHAAHFIRVTAPIFAKHGVDLAANLRQAQTQTAGKSQDQRCASRVACPFVIGGACAIYAARPLACRGHMSFDRNACVAAIEGGEAEVPISIAHKTVRCLVQGALQSALHDAGLGWGAYEFLAALDRALDRPDCETLWRQGQDVFAEFRLDEASALEQGSVNT